MKSTKDKILQTLLRHPKITINEIAQAVGINAKAVWFQLDVVDHDAYARTTAAGLTMVMNHCPAIEWGRLGPS